MKPQVDFRDPAESADMCRRKHLSGSMARGLVGVFVGATIGAAIEHLLACLGIQIPFLSEYRRSLTFSLAWIGMLIAMFGGQPPKWLLVALDMADECMESGGRSKATTEKGREEGQEDGGQP